jgi:hypothetical protein
MGEYDHTVKMLVDKNPEAIARFVLGQWQKQHETAPQEKSITAVTQLSIEFPQEILEGDHLLLVESQEITSRGGACTARANTLATGPTDRR